MSEDIYLIGSRTFANIFRDEAKHYWTEGFDRRISQVLNELADKIDAEADKGLQAHGRIRREPDESVTVHHELTLRPNPEQPSPDKLWEIYMLASTVSGTAEGNAAGLAAVWRNGVDTGMVAP